MASDHARWTLSRQGRGSVHLSPNGTIRRPNIRPTYISICNRGSIYCEVYAVSDRGALKNLCDDRGRSKASNIFFALSFPSIFRLSLQFLLSSLTKSGSTAREAIFDSWCRLFQPGRLFQVSGLRSGASLSPHYGSEHPNDGDLHFHFQTGLKRISSVASHRRKRTKDQIIGDFIMQLPTYCNVH